MATIEDTLLTDLAHKKDFLPTPGGDLSVLSGVANLRDALFARLVTVPGSLVHRPEYGVGIKLYQNSINSLAKQRQLSLAIESNFGRDPRVEKVTGVLVDYNELNPSLTKIKVRIKPIGLEAVVIEFSPFNEA